MANFHYKAKSSDGKEVKGFIEAVDKKQAVFVLNEKKLYCYSLVEKTDGFFSAFKKKFLSKISFSEVVTFTRQLATMINAGLPLTDSLSLLRAQSSSKLSGVVALILRDVREGVSLAESLKKYPRIFSPVFIALVNAGESAGILDSILNRLADNLEAQREFNSKLKNAMIYPAIILIAMVAVIIGMMVLVIPKLSVLFKEFDAELPPTTKMLISLSNFMVSFWWLFPIFGLGIYYLFFAISSTKAGREKIDRIKFKIPIYSPLYKKVILTEFSRTLGILVNAGVSLVDALKISSKTANNVIVENAIGRSREQVEKGLALSSSLAQHALFPPIVGQMISVGEETGKMGDVLAKVARFFQSESEESLKGLTTALEPLIMVLLGVGVLFLIIAIIMPIYNLSSQFK